MRGRQICSLVSEQRYQVAVEPLAGRSPTHSDSSRAAPANLIQRLGIITLRYYSPFVCLSLAIAGIPLIAQADTGLETAKQLFPAVVEDLARQCATPSTLSTEQVTSHEGVELTLFTCWSAADESGNRRGQWLGNLPIGSTNGAFGEPLACHLEDEVCHRWLPTLQRQYPAAIQQAEFQCAIKHSTLSQSLYLS